MSEKKQMSQATIIGRPPPETWQELARDCIGAFGGGHQTSEARRIFHHGIQTVFNLLEGEFPSLAEVKGIEGLRAEVARLRGLGVDNEVLRNEVGTLRASLSLHLTRNTELHHQGNQLANEVARLALAANEWAAREQATRDKLERFIVENHRLRDQIRELAAWKADAERLASVLRADARAHLAEWAMQLEAEGVSSEEVERQRPNYERNDARCQALAAHAARLAKAKEAGEVVAPDIKKALWELQNGLEQAERGETDMVPYMEGAIAALQGEGGET